MPRTNKPKRKPLIVRLTAEEREQLKIVGLYLNQTVGDKIKLAGAARVAIRFAYRTINTAKTMPSNETIEFNPWDEK